MLERQTFPRQRRDMGERIVRDRVGRPRRADRPAFDLYASKLHRPPMRSGTIGRSSLIKQLADGPWPQIDLALAGGRGGRDAEALIANLGAMVLAHTGLALRRINRLEASAAAAALVSDEQERERFLERVLGFARRGSRTLALGV